jgi:hypothetical protein
MTPITFVAGFLIMQLYPITQKDFAHARAVVLTAETPKGLRLDFLLACHRYWSNL